MPLILGIESTAHTIGVAFATEKKILSNEIAKYPSSQEGYIPRKLADHHAEHFKEVFERSIAKAKVDLEDVDAIAYAHGPGLGHSLHVGFTAAKALREQLGKPIVPVNHGIAHIEVARLYSAFRDPLVAYVSGGNTQLVTLQKIGKKKFWKPMGETMDVGIGNFLDSLGRQLSLEPADAIGVMHAARKSTNYVPFPYTVKGMNLAFSGLLSHAKRMEKTESKNDICYSAQETAFSMFAECAERALLHSEKKEFLLVGGNARNARLQEILQLMCKENRSRFAVPPFEHCGDAAGMTAYTGARMLHARVVPRAIEPEQKLRIDSQEIAW